MTTTSASEPDLEQVEELLHAKEALAHADAGYAKAQNYVRRRNLRFEIEAKRGRIKAMRAAPERRTLERIEHRKASMRAKVEHPLRVLKRQSSLVKVRFRGLGKNTAQFITVFALSNLCMVRRRLLAMTGALRPQLAA